METSTRRILKVLAETNQLDLEDEHRRKLLETLRPVLKRAWEYLDRRLAEAAYPLTDRLRELSDLNLSVQTELATGFKILVENHASGARQEKQDVIASDIVAALLHTGREMFYHWLTYSSPPASAWRELHLLFAYAEQCDLSDLPVHCVTTIPDVSRDATPTDIYLRTLLLATAQPFSLRPRELLDVAKLLEILAPHGRLVASSSSPVIGNQYLVDLESDRPPVDARVAGPKEGPQWRRLITDQIVRALDAMDPGPGIGLTIVNGRTQCPAHLAHHLKAEWDLRPKRAFHRHRENLRVQIYLGMDGSSRLAKTNPNQVGEVWAARGHDELEWLEHNLRSLPDPDSDAFLDPNQVDSGGISTSWSGDNDWLDKQGAEKPGEDETDVPVAYCRVINESAGGYGLFWEASNAGHARVGEVLYLQNLENGQVLGLGTIRWIKAFSGGQLQLGVELLAPVATPTRVSKTGDTTQRPALLLPEIPSLQRPANLLLPPLGFQVGDTLRLAEKNSLNLVRLTRKLETTGSYSRFQYLELKALTNG